MSTRVHDLAKHCGLSNREMIEKLRTINYPVKSNSSNVDKITAAFLEQEYGYVPPPPPPPAAPKPLPATVVPQIGVPPLPTSPNHPAIEFKPQENQLVIHLGHTQGKLRRKARALHGIQQAIERAKHEHKELLKPRQGIGECA